jgi:segregation and condensation protein B
MENFSNNLSSNGIIEQETHIKGIVETLLFISERPVMLDQLKKVLDTVNPADIKRIIQVLKAEFEQRNSGMTIVEIAGGYQMLSNPAYASYARSFYKTKHKEKLSKPALESLAIIAYRQPVTRSDIELIRGVNSDGVVAHLLNKELLKVVGRKDVPGRPFLYGTTKQFLEYFGLKSLEDLPDLEEFPTLQPADEDNSAEKRDKELTSVQESARAEKDTGQQIAKTEDGQTAKIATDVGVAVVSQGIRETGPEGQNKSSEGQSVQGAETE